MKVRNPAKGKEPGTLPWLVVAFSTPLINTTLQHTGHTTFIHPAPSHAYSPYLSNPFTFPHAQAPPPGPIPMYGRTVTQLLLEVEQFGR